MLWSAILGFARKDDSWEIRELSDFLFPFLGGDLRIGGLSAADVSRGYYTDRRVDRFKDGDAVE